MPRRMTYNIIKVVAESTDEWANGYKRIDYTLFAVGCVIVFAATFLAGDIAGLIIEAQSARRWRMAAERMGFAFDGRKRKSHSLSELFLPTLIFREPKKPRSRTAR